MTWEAIPVEVKSWIRWGAVIGGFLATFAGGIAVSAPTNTPDRLSRVELRVDTLASRMNRRDGVQFCRWRAEDRGMDPRVCWDLLPDAAEFDPPALKR
jgi:hypothetical protein